MRIVLKQERMLCVLKNPIPLVHNEDADNEVMIKYKCYVENDEHATYMKLASILLELQYLQKFHHENKERVTLHHCQPKFKQL